MVTCSEDQSSQAPRARKANRACEPGVPWFSVEVRCGFRGWFLVAPKTREDSLILNLSGHLDPPKKSPKSHDVQEYRVCQLRPSSHVPCPHYFLAELLSSSLSVQVGQASSSAQNKEKPLQNSRREFKTPKMAMAWPDPRSPAFW